MELLLILASLAAIVLFVWLYHASVKALNLRAEASYGYQPISILTSLLAMAAYVVAIVGIWMGGDNALVGLLAGLALFIFLFLRVAVKTSLLIALLALPLLAIAGLGLIIVTALLVLVFGKNKEEKTQTGA